jgi:hypothetical protein
MNDQRDKIDKAAAKAGISAKKLQDLRFAADNTPDRISAAQAAVRISSEEFVLMATNSNSRADQVVKLADRFAADLVNLTLATLEQRRAKAVERVLNYLSEAGPDQRDRMAPRDRRVSPYPLFPDIVIPLADTRASGSHLVRAVKIMMGKDQTIDLDKITAFERQATAGDFDQLLRTVLEFVRVS